MRRYWWPEEISKDKSVISIEGEVFKHIFKVCRRDVGDHFELLNEDLAYLVEVLEVSKNLALVSVKSKREISPLKEPHIHLVLSFSQPKVVERVLEKCVELGVKSVQLISTSNSFLKGQNKIQTKIDRSEKIITQAMQQSGRGVPLVLKKPKSFSEFLADFKGLQAKEAGALGFMFYEGQSMLNKATKEPSKSEKAVKDIFILVGSEGGFTTQEAELALRSGFRVMSLGEQILRVETACVASISVLKSSFEVW